MFLSTLPEGTFSSCAIYSIAIKINTEDKPEKGAEIKGNINAIPRLMSLLARIRLLLNVYLIDDLGNCTFFTNRVAGLWTCF